MEYGKFRTKEEMMKAYNCLEAEFTKKCQQLAKVNAERRYESNPIAELPYVGVLTDFLGDVDEKYADIDKMLADMDNDDSDDKALAMAAKSSGIVIENIMRNERDIETKGNDIENSEDMRTKENAVGKSENIEKMHNAAESIENIETKGNDIENIESIGTKGNDIKNIENIETKENDIKNAGTACQETINSLERGKDDEIGKEGILDNKEKEISMPKMYEAADWGEKVKGFIGNKRHANNYKSDIMREIMSDERLAEREDCLDIAYARVLDRKFRPVEDILSDDSIISEQIDKNPELKNKIIREYLSDLMEKKTPPVITGRGAIAYTPPKMPKNLDEAAKLFLGRLYN